MSSSAQIRDRKRHAVDASPIPSLPRHYRSQLNSIRHRASTRAGPRSSTGQLRHPSSLDFERVVNEYSINAMRNKYLFETEQPQQPHRPVPSEEDGKPLVNMEEDTAYDTFADQGNNQTEHSTLKMQRRKKNLMGYTGRTALRWMFAIMTGFSTGMISIFIVSCTEAIGGWRSNLMDKLWRDDSHRWTIFFVFVLTNLVLALMSSALCLFLAPEAVGSGIPEVKAFLNGVRVKRFTSFSLFFVKIVATILSVSSGLVIGPEGPLVHIGAIVGASCTKLSNTLLRFLPRACFFSPRLWSFVTKDLSHFATDDERRDLVSIGAAAGFAAAFGAPIGGLLFAIEEASTHIDHKMFLKTLSATAIATFCLALFHGDLSEYSVISMGDFQTPNHHIFYNRVAEIPLYIIVAVVGGTLGGLFCKFWHFLQVFRERHFRDRTALEAWKLAEVAIVSVLTSTLTYGIPAMQWACRSIDVNDDLVQVHSVFDRWRFHAHQFDCPTGEINELATIFFGSREEAISDILSKPVQFQMWTLLATGLVFFLLMTLTLGVALPSGIFMPTFLIGSSLGGVGGLIFSEWLNQEVAASTFALLGAAALLAGIQRSTVSLCVILVEGTGQVKILIPVIITVVVARYVASLVCEDGLYEIAMEVNHYPYISNREEKTYDVVQVSEIMTPSPVVLGPCENAHRLVKILRTTDHQGFPVVDPKTGRFLGLIRRDQVVALLQCGVFMDENVVVADSLRSELDDDDEEEDYDGSMYKGHASSSQLAQDEFDLNSWLVSVQHRDEIVSSTATGRGDMAADEHLYGDEMPKATAVRQSRQSMASLASMIPDVLRPVPEHQMASVASNSSGKVYIQWLDPVCRKRYVNIFAAMNQGSYCVTELCPVSKAHHLFIALGLRHLVVLGGETGGQVVGVISRGNLLKEYIQEASDCEV